MDQENYIKREIFEDVAGHVLKPEITLITGPRQTGKTILLLQLKEWLIKNKKVNPQNILFFNLDIVKDWEFFQDQTQFIEFINEKSSRGKIYVFVDEAQKVPNCSVFFKGVIDSRLNAKLILTGSASFELKTKLKESLSGRKRLFALYPFSFYEFLLVKENGFAKYLKEKAELPEIIKRRLLHYYLEYMIWGGYPKVVFEPQKEERVNILAEIYSSYIEKDVVGLLEIKNKLGFTNLVRLLMNQIGQLINIAELSCSLNLDRETVEKYIHALEETYIIKTLLPFYKNRRQEIIKQNKIYAVDLGLRNYLIEELSPFKKRADAGFILENAVYKEVLLSLSPLERIRFWRTKIGAEVDFVIIRGQKTMPIEVKTNIRKPSINQGIRSFIEKYSPARAAGINLSISSKSIKLNSTQINFLFPFEYFSFSRRISRILQ